MVSQTRFSLVLGVLAAAVAAFPSRAIEAGAWSPRPGETYAKLRPKLLSVGYRAMLVPGTAQSTSPCRDWTAAADCPVNSFPESSCAIYLDPCTYYWETPNGRRVAIVAQGLQAEVSEVRWADQKRDLRALANRKAYSLAMIEAAAAAKKAHDCLGSLRAPLTKGDMSGLFDCQDGDIKIRFLGRTTGRTPYRIYDWRYTGYGNPGTAVHVGERILLFDDQLTYVGQYLLPGWYRVTVRGSSIRINAPAKDGNVLKLDGPHPPRYAWLDGENEDFFR